MGATQSENKTEIKIPANFHLNLPPNTNTSNIKILRQDPNQILFQLPITLKPTSKHSSSISCSIASTRPSNSTNKYSSRSNNNNNCRSRSSRKQGLTCTINQQRNMRQKQQKQIQVKQFIMKRVHLTADNQIGLRSALDNAQHLFRQGGKMEEKKDGAVCKLVGFEREYDGFMCGRHSAVTMIFQYFGDRTLADEMQSRSQQIFSKTRRVGNSQSIQQLLNYNFKMPQILKITKFLLQLSQTLLQTSPTHIPTLSLSNIIIHPQSPTPTYIYQNPLDCIYTKNNINIIQNSSTSAYFPTSPLSPLSQKQNNIEQQYNTEVIQKILINIGICILSLCLLEDCYQTCFGYLGDLCASVCEKKIQFLFQMYGKENQSLFLKEFCFFLGRLLFQGGREEKISLAKAKSMFNRMYINYQKEAVKNKIEISCMQLLDESLSTSPIIKKACNISQNMKSSKSMALKCENIQKQWPTTTNPYKKSTKNNNTSVYQPQNSSKKEQKCIKLKDWNIDKSSQRKFQINQTQKPRIRQWIIQKQQNFILQQPDNKVTIKDMHYDMIYDKYGKEDGQSKYGKCDRYEEIDKRWSQDQQLFKGMPQFSRFSSQVINLHFDLPGFEPIQVQSNEHVFLR